MKPEVSRIFKITLRGEYAKDYKDTHPDLWIEDFFRDPGSCDMEIKEVSPPSKGPKKFVLCPVCGDKPSSTEVSKIRVDEPKCGHDKGLNWINEECPNGRRKYIKAFQSVCPWCKEPKSGPADKELYRALLAVAEAARNWRLGKGREPISDLVRALEALDALAGGNGR